METQATPRPWTVTLQGDRWRVRGNHSTGTEQHVVHVYNKANATLIVRAVNQHDALVEALEDLLQFRPAIENTAQITERDRAVDQARAALDAARSE